MFENHTNTRFIRQSDHLAGFLSFKEGGVTTQGLTLNSNLKYYKMFLNVCLRKISDVIQVQTCFYFITPKLLEFINP